MRLLQFNYAFAVVLLGLHWIAALRFRRPYRRHWLRFGLLVLLSAVAVAPYAGFDYFYEPIAALLLLPVVVLFTFPAMLVGSAGSYWRLDLWKGAAGRLRLARRIDPTAKNRRLESLALSAYRITLGETPAFATLEALVATDVGAQALSFLGTLGDRWEEVVARTERPEDQVGLKLSVRARALGESGRREELLRLAEAQGAFRWRDPVQGAVLVFTAAFYGQRALFDRMWLRHFSIFPWRRNFWATTADLYAGGEAERAARARFASPCFEKHRWSLGSLERRRKAKFVPLTAEEHQRLDALAAKIPYDPREPEVYRR